MTVSPGPWIRERGSVDNTVAAAANLAAALGVPVALKALGLRLRTHPRFPKLAALMDSLDETGIRVQAVGGDIEELPTAPLPAIAHVTPGGQGQFVVLVEVNRDRVRYIDSIRGPVDATLEEFAKLWSGVLLLPGPGGEVQADQRAARRSERLEALRVPVLTGTGLVVLAALVLFTGQPIAPEFSGLWLLLVALKTAGLLASAGLVALSNGSSTPLTRRLCPAGRVVDCASVLQSPAARLFGWIPMADLGAIYFLGGLITLAAARWNGDPAAALGLLAALTFVTLPYSVFSIGYQAIVVRRWCWLCLAVMALFWAEALVLMLASPLPLRSALVELRPSASALAAAAFILPAVAWGLLMPLYGTAAVAGRQFEELLRRRRDPLFIEQGLSGQTAKDLGTFEPEIADGPESAPLQLTLVSHPLCAVCQEVHRKLERLVAESGGQIRCLVRLGYRSTSEAGGDIARRVIGIAHSLGGEMAYAALRDWYADPGQGTARWLERFPLERPPPRERIEAVFEAHCAVVRSAGIMGVPSIFLNGRLLPPELAPEDLRIFLRLQS
jgi:uncharacterized membrane protein